MKEEGLEEGIALKKLLTLAISEWKKERALKMLSEGKISYLKAAKEAGMNVWDFAEFLRENKIVWVKGVGIHRDLNARFRCNLSHLPRKGWKTSFNREY